MLGDGSGERSRPLQYVNTSVGWNYTAGPGVKEVPCRQSGPRHRWAHVEDQIPPTQRAVARFPLRGMSKVTR